MIAEANSAARYVVAHSGEFFPVTATLSPFFMPLAVIQFASFFMLARTCAYVSEFFDPPGPSKSVKHGLSGYRIAVIVTICGNVGHSVLKTFPLNSSKNVHG